MADRPILFSGPMVRAILDGRKTQTRRVLKPAKGLTLGEVLDEGERNGSMISCARHQVQEPPFAPGDRLWVREAFSYETLDVDRDGFMPPWYWADGNPTSGDFTRPKPSIHMPRWASRLTLIVTDVRVQRLQEISEDDAKAEGIERMKTGRGYYDPTVSKAMVRAGVWHRKAAHAFEALWDSLNAKRGFGWEANPWVVAVTFTVSKTNIDQLEANHG